MMIEKHEIILEMLYEHDYCGYLSEKATDRMNAIISTMDFKKLVEFSE